VCCIFIIIIIIIRKHDSYKIPIRSYNYFHKGWNAVVRTYLSPTPVGVGVGTSLIWAVDQTLLLARVWLRETIVSQVLDLDMRTVQSLITKKSTIK